ncbi:MAG TPA: cytochrome c [Thermoanaerobaculia bacterium]|nr:cytochrome c [Thermoanaerobaculia bacterium]
MRPRRRAAAPALAAALLALAAAGCRQNMHDQGRFEPFEASPFFADGSSARPLPAGTVARGQLRADEAAATGVGPGGAFLAAPPFPLSRRLLERGRDRFGVFCAPCHDGVGTGRGMIVQRGFTQPTSFHDPRLKGSALGYFYNVMTEGYGVMPSYAPQVTPEERWAIAAYIRALQLSQEARLADLPVPLRRAVERELAEGRR